MAASMLAVLLISANAPRPVESRRVVAQPGAGLLSATHTTDLLGRSPTPPPLPAPTEVRAEVEPVGEQSADTAVPTTTTRPSTPPLPQPPTSTGGEPSAPPSGQPPGGSPPESGSDAGQPPPGVRPTPPTTTQATQPQGVCDRAYWTTGSCVPWLIPWYVEDSCSWLRNRGVGIILVPGQDRHGLDGNRDGVGCFLGDRGRY
ncbi:hypothetical protein LV78_001756 [Actinosynnema pretiosum]|nr:hypothetical protein [Actinosynnema pretiosum]